MTWRARLGERTVWVVGIVSLGLLTGLGFLAIYRLLTTPGGEPVSVPNAALLSGIGFSIVSSVVAILFVVVALRSRDHVDEVFLVHESGLLLAHISKTLRPDKDRDIVVAMLTAVQSFILEAFAQGSSGELRQMEFSGRTILLRRGRNSYLAVVARRRLPLGFTVRMRRVLAQVEATYPVIGQWDGTTESLSGVDELLLEAIVQGGLRAFVQDLLDVLRRLAPWRRTAASSEESAGAAKHPGFDPRDTAGALLERPELQKLQPGFRDLIATALEQIREGRFTLAGLTNLYLTLALQTTPRPSAAGWWNEVLRTVRAVLQTWPWEPVSQSWAMAAAPSAPAGEPAVSLPSPPVLPAGTRALGRRILSRSRNPGLRTKPPKDDKPSRASRRTSRI